MRPQQLRASEVTSSGFRLAWPPLLTADSGYYVLELAPSSEPGTARRQQLPGNATGWAWTGLDPDTDYDVALVPESNVRLVKPQHLRVRTLPGKAGRGGRGVGPGRRGAGRGGGADAGAQSERRGAAPTHSRALPLQRRPRRRRPGRRRPGRSASLSRTPGRAACA